MTDQLQFPNEWITSTSKSNVSVGYTLRPLSLKDFDKGFLTLLGQLTVVGDITPQQFKERFEFLQSRNDQYMCIVIEEEATGRIVGSGTVFIERKFIRNTGCAGHIEDIVTDESIRGKGLGKAIILTLMDLAKSKGAYKVLLSCKEEKAGFYEKCGLERKSVTYMKYL